MGGVKTSSTQVVKDSDELELNVVQSPAQSSGCQDECHFKFLKMEVKSSHLSLTWFSTNLFTVALSESSLTLWELRSLQTLSNFAAMAPIEAQADGLR